MPLTNLMVNQQGQVYIQAQAQEYEQKDTVSMRVIDEATLRIYFPRLAEVTATIPSVYAFSLSHSTTLTFDTHEKDKDVHNNKGPLLLLNTPTPL